MSFMHRVFYLVVSINFLASKSFRSIVQKPFFFLFNVWMSFLKPFFPFLCLDVFFEAYLDNLETKIPTVGQIHTPNI
jgi:hypothetical protein